MVSPWSGRRTHRSVCALVSAHIWLGKKLLEIPSHHSWVENGKSVWRTAEGPHKCDWLRKCQMKLSLGNDKLIHVGKKQSSLH